MATSARLDELKKKFDENPRRYFAPLANEYRKLGDLTQAIALCRAHLPNQPGHISGHIVLAQALYEARELGESRQIFEASLDLDPENLIALRYLGDIAREQGEPVQARGWYERVLDADPRNEEIALLLRELDGQATVTDGEDESRVPAFEDVQRHDTSNYDAASFTPTTSFESQSSGSHLIDPLVAGTGSETPAWGSTASASPDAAFSEKEELLHDLPAADEPLSFFESPSSDDVFASSGETVDDDPFFGASDAAAALDSEELAPGAASVEEDWFASASASPEHEAVEELASADASPFEDSFLPDLAQVTPIDSLVVREVSDPEAAPTFMDAQDEELRFDASPAAETRSEATPPAPMQSSIPTPSFLSAVDDSSAPESHEPESVAPEALTGEFFEGEALAVESFDSDSAEPESLPDAFPAAVEHRDFDAFLASAPTPSPAPFAIPFEVAADDSDEFEAQQTIESEPGTPEFAAASAVERDEPTLEVDVTAPLDATSEVDHDVRATSDDDAAFGSDALIAGFDDVVSGDATLDAPVLESDGDFVVEYGEFQAPADADIPFIANSVSVPLAGDDAVYEAPEIEAIEPSAVLELAQSFDDVSLQEVSLDDVALDEEVAPTVHGDATPEFVAEEVEVSDAPLVGERRESWRDAGEIAPIEGLISREVDVVAESGDLSVVDEESEPETSPAFVTETMAELYLQQGFTEEALAIYRQLLAQQPDDATLQDRIAAIERGAASTVVDRVAPRDSIDRAGQSVRNFFGHFARRSPRGRDAQSDAGVGGAPVNPESASPESEGRTAGAANRDEALTVPDEDAAPATLSQLFASGVVSGADENAASNLASAFGGDDGTPASRIAERELSLEHLFRDVPARSSSAVTLDELYQASSPGDSPPEARDAADGEERGADIEQFKAWLEGLKKR